MKRTNWLVTVIVASLASTLVVSSASGQRMEGANAAGIFDYEVTNEDGVPLADAYERLGGVDVLGHAVSYRFAGPGGTSQVMQVAVLEWGWPRPGRVRLGRIFQIFEQRGLDDWLLHTKGIPRSLDDGVPAGEWEREEKVRLTWLTNEKIKAKFLANPNPNKIAAWSENQAIRLYGLPMSYPERHGPFISQRFQKVAFQLWVDEVEGMPAPGTVVLVLGGDLFKEAGLVSWRAWSPEERPRPMTEHFPEPPITVTYEDSWGEGARHWMGEPGDWSPKTGTRGPFMNFYFQEKFVGRKLTIRHTGFVCREDFGYDCGPQVFVLYRSLVGAVEPGRGYYLPGLTNKTYVSGNGFGRYDAEYIAGGKDYGDYEEIVWEIELPGVYFVYFGYFHMRTVSGIQYDASPLITYTVSVE